ncbi:MAG: transglutaminase [Acidobacteria bacterium]|nr:MAG: transglutaminase [Acidobacteriota bacterium]
MGPATVDRRSFLRRGLTVAAATVAGRFARPARAAAAADAGPGWRTFEVVMHADVLQPSGPSRVWLPMPLVPDTDYHRSLGHSFAGNAARTHVYDDGKYGAQIFYAEWPARAPAPSVDVTYRFATRDRAVDLTAPPKAHRQETRAALAKYLEPTRLIRTDGIVAATAQRVTQGRRGEVDKARAVYDWIVENTFRDPKVRGCGIGDIRAMLETGNLGGKCADLNALFVGLARAAGVPARDVYGMRVAESAEFKCLGKSGDVSKAQHCRAEFYAPEHGWVPVDPADVRKVILEEKGGLSPDDPIVRRARAKLFGAWEMNYLAFNHAHDVALPNSTQGPLGFLMYPQAETGAGRKDCLDPETFRYRITSRELELEAKPSSGGAA